MEANNGQHRNQKSSVANNGQKSDKNMKAKNGKKDKARNSAETGDSPCCWKSPLKCIIDITEFLERAKSYAHLVVEGGLLEDPDGQ